MGVCPCPTKTIRKRKKTKRKAKKTKSVRTKSLQTSLKTPTDNTAYTLLTRTASSGASSATMAMAVAKSNRKQAGCSCSAVSSSNATWIAGTEGYGFVGDYKHFNNGKRRTSRPKNGKVRSMNHREGGIYSKKNIVEAPTSLYEKKYRIMMKGKGKDKIAWRTSDKVKDMRDSARKSRAMEGKSRSVFMAKRVGGAYSSHTDTGISEDFI
tara:strand:+ start:2427 stop:3056 length:630 start_codon:yes stop_codon:yes gene_type:complete